MKRLILLLAIISLPAHAIQWPWSEQKDTRYGYCKGFVVSALGEYPVEDLSRTQLWLAWNHILRAMLPEGSVTDAEYQEGTSGFGALLASGDRQGLLEIANHECGLGRN